jgi:hypothetical protein
MNKRDFLKSALAAAVVPAIKGKAKAGPEAFVADIVIDFTHPLFGHATPFLEGKQVDYCFAASIGQASFDRSAFGELIVAVKDEQGKVLHTLYQKELKPDTLDYEGFVARKVSGNVHIKLDDNGRRILAHIREAEFENRVVRAITKAKREGGIRSV